MKQQQPQVRSGAALNLFERSYDPSPIFEIACASLNKQTCVRSCKKKELCARQQFNAPAQSHRIALLYTKLRAAVAWLHNITLQL